MLTHLMADSCIISVLRGFTSENLKGSCIPYCKCAALNSATAITIYHYKANKMCYLIKNILPTARKIQND